MRTPPRPGVPATTSAAPPPRRRLRWLRRLAVALVVLGALGLAGFTWFAYWPLEGKVGRIDALVPEDVDFLYRASWAELKASGWVRRNVLDDPVLPALDPARVDVGEGRTLSEALATIPAREDEINASVPGPAKVLQGLFFGSREFRVEKDLFLGETVAAGRWCAGGSPAEGPPRWREILLLVRVSPLVKLAFEAMRHDVVRERALARPDLRVEATADGLLRVETPAPPARRRQTCEGGHEMAPLNVWWVARVKDVLAIGNAEDLVLGVKEVAKGRTQPAVATRGFDAERPEGALLAAMDLVGLRSWLTRFFSGGGGEGVADVVGRFVAVDTLEKARATVSPLEDGLAVAAEVDYAEGRVAEFRDVAATYAEPPRPVAEGVARLLPAKDTAFVLQVSTPARTLLRAVWERLSESDRRIVAARVREKARELEAAGEKGYEDVGEFLDDLGRQLGSDAAVAVSRISSEMRDDMYAEWYPTADEPDPQAALTVVVKIRAGARQEEVDEFLRGRLGALRMTPERAASPEGVEYTRLVPEGGMLRQYRLHQPAYKVHDGHFILSTREDYLLDILRVMRGGPEAPPTVAASPAFRAVAGSLPSAATLSLYVNGDEMRALAWDFRNPVVRRRHDDAAHALEFRARRVRDLGRQQGGRVDFRELDARVTAEVEEEMKRYRTEGYRAFVEAYRRELDESRRLAAFGFAFAPRARGAGVLDVGARLLVRPSEPAAR